MPTLRAQMDRAHGGASQNVRQVPKPLLGQVQKRAETEVIQWDGIVEDWQELPELPGIYIALSGDTAMYVGRSTNIRARWNQHGKLIKALQLQRKDVRIAWIKGEPTAELEQAWINKLRPTWNHAPAHVVTAVPMATALDAPRLQSWQKQVVVYLDEDTFTYVQEAAKRSGLKMRQWFKMLAAEKRRHEELK